MEKELIFTANYLEAKVRMRARGLSREQFFFALLEEEVRKIPADWKSAENKVLLIGIQNAHKQLAISLGLVEGESG